MKINEIVSFVFIFLLQIVLVNNLGLTIITPAIYLYIIIKMPFSINSLYVLLIAFALGVLFDLSVMTPGVQSFTITLTAFLRVPLYNLFLSRDMYENTKAAVISLRNNQAYLLYAVSVVVIYYFILQIVDGILSISLLKFLINIAIGTSATMIILLIYDKLFCSKKQKTIA